MIIFRQKNRRGANKPKEPDGRTRTTDNFSAPWTVTASLSAVAAALFAGWAAWETRASAFETARATRAATWMQMLTEYESPDTLSAMKELRNWQEDHAQDFPTRFEKLLELKCGSDTDRQLAATLDGDRRRILGFFSKVVVLNEMGIVSKSEVALSWDIGTYRFIKEVLMPLEYAKIAAMLHNGYLTRDQATNSDEDDARLEKFYLEVAEIHQRVFVTKN